MRLLLIAPQYDAEIPGESWSTYQWVKGLSEHCDTVVLTQHRRDWVPDRSRVKARQVVNWSEPDLPGLDSRFNWELKATYPLFYWRARRWIKEALRRGEKFDLIHQLNPIALRYPSPARALGVPYVIGPLAGSLPTPPGLDDTASLFHWYRQLRRFDTFRLKYDPWLRGTYGEAAAVLGVAPYVRDRLQVCGVRRFELMAETGVPEVSTTGPKTLSATEPLRLLFVGRLIRTKGILEAIEAVAWAKQQVSVTLDIVGAGHLNAECAKRVGELGLEKIVTLHGWQSRAEVFRWYERSHVFLFPSYREPSGNVVFEAMSRGLPVITSTVGGPGYVVTDGCGMRIAPDNRNAFVEGLAHAIATLASEPARLSKLSTGALDRIRETALWSSKIAWMMNLYRDIWDRQTNRPPKSEV